MRKHWPGLFGSHVHRWGVIIRRRKTNLEWSIQRFHAGRRGSFSRRGTFMPGPPQGIIVGLKGGWRLRQQARYENFHARLASRVARRALLLNTRSVEETYARVAKAANVDLCLAEDPV